MATSGIQWLPGKSPKDLAARLVRDYGVSRHMAAVAAVAKKLEPVLEGYAKTHRPWEDQTGHARQSLFSVSELAAEIVTIYLSHGMEYGVFLELCNSGQYAIIMPTLEANYGVIKAALDRLYR